MSEFVILKSGIDLLVKNRDDFWQIYYEAFTQSPYENQYIDINEEEPWLFSLFKKWNAFCYYAFSEDRLIGFMLIAPSAYDSKLPDETWQSLSQKDCLSIAELAVSKQYRKQGIGKQLLNDFLSDFEDKMILVRTNKSAKIAHRLYEHNGFVKLLDFNTKNRVIERETIRRVLTPKVLYVRKV